MEKIWGFGLEWKNIILILFSLKLWSELKIYRTLHKMIYSSNIELWDTLEAELRHRRPPLVAERAPEYKTLMHFESTDEFEFLIKSKDYFSEKLSLYSKKIYI